MSIKYDIHAIHNSKGSGEKRKFVHLLEVPAMSEKRMEERIDRHCALSKGACAAVLTALRDIIEEDLIDGKRCYIPQIGYFSLAAALDLPEGKTMDKVRGDYISVRNINFKPEGSLLEKVKGKARFERAEYTTNSMPYTEEQLELKIREYLATNRYINRRIMEQEFLLSQHSAYKWLNHFAEKGILTREGSSRSYIYFLNTTV